MTNIQAAKNRLNNQLDTLMRMRTHIAQMSYHARTSDQAAASRFAREMNENNINCITAVLKDLKEV
jgi:HAMP domain-containing protein